MFFDSVHGGFGDGLKFPTVPPLSLSLRQSDRTKDLTHQEKVLRQLRMMAPGGIYDHLAGFGTKRQAAVFLRTSMVKP